MLVALKNAYSLIETNVDGNVTLAIDLTLLNELYRISSTPSSKST